MTSPMEELGDLDHNTMIRSMEIKVLYRLLPLLPILCACQTEIPQESIVPNRVLRVKATLPGTDETRTHITYGNPDFDKELFRWDDKEESVYEENDYIALYNVSRLSQCPPEGVQLDVTEIHGRSAVFETVDEVDSKLEIKTGDIIFVNYGATLLQQNSDLSYDNRKIFKILYAGTESNKPQIIVSDPTDEAYMSYMQGNLKMYDIVTVIEDNKIPDLHFKHLSAILRITLRNETGKDLYPTKLEFKYPGTESFFTTVIYCSADALSPGGLKVYTDNEFYNNSNPYTDNIGTTINTKDGTTDTGEAIPPGKTYDLYLSTVPRIENKQTGSSLSIHLIKNHDTDHPYTITLDGFNMVIEAGKRYWFNLTAVEEGGENKLVLTSDWLDQHPEQDTTSGE